MNHEQAKKLLPIIQAFADGKDIQYCSNLSGHWVNTKNPTFDSSLEYRIKPEPRVFWIDPAADNDSACWWLTQEEYESGKWDYCKDSFIRVIEDLQDE